MDSSYKERVRIFENELSAQELDFGDDDDDNLEWKPMIDMKAFRERCIHGIPDEPGLRATAWKVLLGYLPPDKRLWPSVLLSQRLSYYNWVRDFMEEPSEIQPPNDHPLNIDTGSKWADYFRDNGILEQIDKDVRRTLPDIAFFQTHVPLNPLNPLSPLPSPEAPIASNTAPPAGDPLGTEEVEKPNKRFSFGLIGRPQSTTSSSRRSLKDAVTGKNRSRSNSRSSVHSAHSGLGTDHTVTSTRSFVRRLSSAFKSNTSLPTPITPPRLKKYHDERNATAICPPVANRRAIFSRIAHLNHDVGVQGVRSSKRQHANKDCQDYHWEAIERILFLYAKLNPGVGYVQGMNELLAPIYYVFAKDSLLDIQAHAEADAFFVFTTLMAHVRDHFVRSLDNDANTGIHATMMRMSQRLSWIDRPLWQDLKKKDVKEQYYAFRWITVLCSQEWDLPCVIRLWDSMLADKDTQEEVGETHFEFLLDFTVAMVLCIRQELLQGDFADNVRLLQNYPLDDIQIVLNTAYAIRETRLNALSAGQIVPGVNDRRDSTTFGSDWSDSSSVRSTSSNPLQRLRDTTGMAKASFDSFRSESRESLTDIFKKGVTMTNRGKDAVEALKATKAGQVGKSFSQRFSAVNQLASRVKRTGASARSPPPPSNTPFDAERVPGLHLYGSGHDKSGSVSSSHSGSSIPGTPSRSNFDLHRFSPTIVTNATVSPCDHTNKRHNMPRGLQAFDEVTPKVTLGHEKTSWYTSTASQLPPSKGSPPVIYQGYV